MVADSQYKYIQFEDGSRELYDLKSDIWETRNLISEFPELEIQYAQLLLKEAVR